MLKSTSTPSVLKDVLNERLQNFADAVGLTLGQVKEALKEKGIDDSDAAIERSLMLLENREYLTFSDLCEAFSDKNLIPKPVLRLGIPYLSGSPETPPEEIENSQTNVIKELANSLKSIDKFSDEELLEKYLDHNAAIEKELSVRSKGKPFIVFNEDKSAVLIDDSIKLMKQARISPKTIYSQIINGKMKKVYRAGDYPDILWDESPVAPGEILIEGFCDKTDTDWSTVSQECRILARLQLEISKQKNQSFDPSKIVSEASQGEKHFRNVYKRAAMNYDELLQTNDLPKLKIRTSKVHKTIDSAGM